MELNNIVLAQLRGPTTYEKMWIIGLSLATIIGLVIVGWCLLKFRQWLKSDIEVGTNSTFSLSEIKQMYAKGQISEEEFKQLKEAFISSHM